MDSMSISIKKDAAGGNDFTNSNSTLMEINNNRPRIHTNQIKTKRVVLDGF